MKAAVLNNESHYLKVTRSYNFLADFRSCLLKQHPNYTVEENNTYTDKLNIKIQVYRSEDQKIIQLVENHQTGEISLINFNKGKIFNYKADEIPAILDILKSL